MITLGYTSSLHVFIVSKEQKKPSKSAGLADLLGWWVCGGIV